MNNSDQYPKLPVLVVDDEEETLRSCRIALNTSGLTNIVTINDSRQVLPFLESQECSVIILDLAMPHVSGQELLEAIRTEYSYIPVIILTGYNDLETAVNCMKGGAQDYLVKPVDKGRLCSSVSSAIQIHELRQENQMLRRYLLNDRLEHPEAFKEIQTVSAAMRSIFRYAESIAQTNQPVLITGETGVGKDLMARAIHRLSGRKGNFVAVNVAGLDDTIFSDTLFGHRRGAFTGAADTRKGLVESAAGGTLFLDEIGDLPMMSQVKILRLLQEREYYPLGSDVAKRSEARIVVATNQRLKLLIKKGDFRKDLYYRLQTHHIEIPPLRDRKEDLPVLVEFFLDEACHAMSKQRPRLPEQIWPLLRNYSFPGNVRELESMVYDAIGKNQSGVLSLDVFKERIFTETRNSDDEVFVGAAIASPEVIFPDRLPTLREVTDLLLQEALRRSENNQSLAARMIGVSQQAVSKRLRKGNGD
jgi:DNA-binding NtrC family response regulator